MEPPKIILQKLPRVNGANQQWSVFRHPEFIVTRRRWDLPLSYSDYQVKEHGKELCDFDRLCDVRDYIADILVERAEEAAASPAPFAAQLGAKLSQQFGFSQ